MALNLDFDKVMRNSLICLKYNGSHPYYNFTRNWYINCFIQQGIYTIVLMLLLYTVAKINIIDEIFEFCSIGSFVVMYCVCSFKYFVLVNYKTEFRYLINIVKQDYVTAESLPEEEQQIVKHYAYKGRSMSTFWVILSSITTCFVVGQPLAKMVYFTITDKFRYVQVLPVVYPAFMKNWSDTAQFSSVFALFIFYDYYSVSLYLGMTPLGPTFLLHATGQLELLRVRMLKLFPDDGSVSFEERTERLKEIAIHLQGVYDFVYELGAAYKLLYELTLKGTSIIAPILAYASIEAYSAGEIKAEFVTLFFGAFALSYQPCYYGDLLVEKSSELRDAVYMSNWEVLYEKKTRSTLLILMTRMERTVAIRSIFVTVCLVAFSDVVHDSYALFNLLCAAL